jgi:hypothetical protein
VWRPSRSWTSVSPPSCSRPCPQDARARSLEIPSPNLPPLPLPSESLAPSLPLLHPLLVSPSPRLPSPHLLALTPHLLTPSPSPIGGKGEGGRKCSILRMLPGESCTPYSESWDMTSQSHTRIALYRRGTSAYGTLRSALRSSLFHRTARTAAGHLAARKQHDQYGHLRSQFHLP